MKITYASGYQPRRINGLREKVRVMPRTLRTTTGPASGSSRYDGESAGDLARCDVVDLQRQSLAAIDQGAGVIEIDLIEVDQIDAALLATLITIMRAAREFRTHIRLLPSPALEQWLKICKLDNTLRLSRSG